MLTPENVATINRLLEMHQSGVSRDALSETFRIRSTSQLSSFIGALRRLGVKLPVSPNLRNGGKRVVNLGAETVISPVRRDMLIKIAALDAKGFKTEHIAVCIGKTNRKTGILIAQARRLGFLEKRVPT